MDFKIGDDIEDYDGSNKNKKSSKAPFIIVIIIAIVVGLLVFFISNAIFGKKDVKVEPIERAPLSLNEENVKILYNYVTYGTKGVRNNKFLTEKNVTIDSFSNQEKFYYALQFAQAEDFENTGRTDEKERKIYNISARTIRTYMQRFFGGSISYATDVMFTYPFSFKINGQNVGYFTESTQADGFDVVFDGLEEDTISNNLIEPYYTELVAAYKEIDGTYTLEEKVIYTELKENEGSYTIYIYKDNDHIQLLETKLNLTKEMIKENPINMNNYKDKASTVTYHFGIFNNMLYFDSSKITSE